MCFSHNYIIEKYCKDKLTISYLFSVHDHKYPANLGKHGAVVAKWSGQSESSTHYDIGRSMSLQYA